MRGLNWRALACKAWFIADNLVIKRGIVVWFACRGFRSSDVALMRRECAAGWRKKQEERSGMKGECGGNGKSSCHW